MLKPLNCESNRILGNLPRHQLTRHSNSLAPLIVAASQIERGQNRHLPICFACYRWIEFFSSYFVRTVVRRILT